MKYKLPQPSPNLTFKEQDTFQRKELAKMLTSVISKTTEPLVISLEAQWGDGKTSFVYKWINYLRDESSGGQRPTALYIDVYKNDFMNDPLLLLASEIYSFAEKNKGPSKAQYQFMKAVAKTSGAIAKGVARGALHWATAGAFSGDQFDKLESSIADELANAGDKAIEDAIKSYGERKQSLDRLSQSLTELAEEIDPDMPLIVIVDELDRCRPAFALELLEVIKHLFSAEKIVFVLVNNPHQMEEVVKANYGVGVDATGYLQKFYDLTIRLPKSQYHNLTEKQLSWFISSTVSYFCESEAFNTYNWDNHILVLVKRKGLSLRDIQKLISYLVVFQGYRAKLPAINRDDIISPALQVGLAYMALKERKLLEQIYYKDARSEFVHAALSLDARSEVIGAFPPDDFDTVWSGFIDKETIRTENLLLRQDIEAYRKSNGGCATLLSTMAKNFIDISIGDT